MSEENVEIVRRLFEERWKRGEYSELDWADPDIDFAIETPDGRRGRGHEELRSAWREFMEAWDDFSVEVEKIIDAGDQVIALGHFRGRGRESGVPIRGTRGAALLWFEDGRVVQLALFGNWEEGLAAAGLSEEEARSSSQ